jgi:hypothetical protein
MAGGGALRSLRLANHPVNSHQFNQHNGVLAVLISHNLSRQMPSATAERPKMSSVNSTLGLTVLLHRN